MKQKLQHAMEKFIKCSLYREARAIPRTPRSIGVQILCFLLVFLTAQVLEAICLMPVILPDYISQLEAAGISFYNVSAVMKFAMDGYVMSEAAMILMLFLTLVATALVLVYCKLIERRSLASMGLSRQGFRQYGKGFLLGAGMMMMLIFVGVLLGTLQMQRNSNLHAGMLALTCCGWLLQGFSEEVVCRGWLMQSLARHHGLPCAVLVSALMFALLHGMNGGVTVLAFLNLFLFGVFAALYFLRTGTLWGIAALHSAWNLVQGSLFGVRVSGLELKNSVLISQPSGAQWLSGGGFGQEGGLPAAILLTVSILLVLGLPAKTGKKTS